MTLRDAVAAIPRADITRRWGRNCERLRAHIMHRDPEHCLRWGIIEETMWASGAYIAQELALLKTDWARWEPAVRETWKGDPKPYEGEPTTCANMIHQACHLAVWEAVTGKHVEDMHGIFEFGGGYGAMARVCRNLGYTGEYTIYDLPIVSELQKWYLDGLGVKCVTEHADIPKGADLFLSMWALSEAPMDVRESVRPEATACANTLIAYQYGFEDVLNVPYFADWGAPAKGWLRTSGTWTTLPIAHMPPNSYYLIGER